MFVIHPLIIHIPIGSLFITLLASFASFITLKYPKKLKFLLHFEVLGLISLLIGIPFLILAQISGFIDGMNLIPSYLSLDIIDSFFYLLNNSNIKGKIIWSFIAIQFFLFNLGLKIMYFKNMKLFPILNMVSTLCGFISLIFVGSLGAKLVYGGSITDYIPFYYPIISEMIWLPLLLFVIVISLIIIFEKPLKFENS